MAAPVEAWSLARLPHPEVPLAFACDPEGALVAISLGADVDHLARQAARAGSRVQEAAASEASARGLAEAAEQLAAYLAGSRRAFALRLRPIGPEFSRRVWAVLLSIPFGVTWSYGQVAVALGTPGASRSVGRACGDNPLPLVIPCHRVVGADGSLTGFGGGLPCKRWLLGHEGALPAATDGATLPLFPGLASTTAPGGRA